MHRIHALALIWLAGGAAVSLGQAPAPRRAAQADPITLERIMADQKWLGRPPQNPYWADDSGSFYYSQAREEGDGNDLIEMDLEGNILRVVADEERGGIDAAGGDVSADGRRKVYARAGDLFLKDLRSGAVRQLTRTREAISNPRFIAGDGRIMYQRGGVTYVRELETGFEFQPADLREEDDPDAEEKESDYLEDQQERLFEIVAKQKRDREQAAARGRTEQEADPTRPPMPWYLGEDVSVLGSTLSPGGDWLVVRLGQRDPAQGKRDSMPNYVSASGYVESRDVRSKVGTGGMNGEQLALLNLNTRERHDLDLGALPGITDDPLRAIKEANGTLEDHDTGGEPRPVRIGNVTWTRDGSRVALQCFSLDNKDRWIAEIDLETGALRTLDHHRDPAWINRRFAQVGWLDDNTTLWYTSEKTGYSHLYLREIADATSRQVTQGEYEVSRVTPSRDGDYLYYTANVAHPGIHEAYRLRVPRGEIEKVSSLGGQNRGVFSPDGRYVLLTHSTATRPPELYLHDTRSGEARRMTNTVSEEFAALPWREPEIVAIPARHGRPVYSRVYVPEDFDPNRAAKYPAVMFVHGAGYLQNAHQGWSNYSREFMFHTLLTRHGYVVIDMDYRASAGYGRDWRTAIYRQMGWPEMEDFEDGVSWLAANRNVDPARVGVYGGSYGGFMTLMSLFCTPDLFACGAALRPVTDWAHYNHGYTANILNTPGVDPAAYEKSSPIEFAEGLTRPLLMCHGMLDDNVFFQDTVRLAQRLIELEKEDWEVAIFPIEAHGFREPSSWLNEYRRIFKLFEAHLKD